MRLPALIYQAPFHQQEFLQSEAGEKPFRQTEKEMAHEEKTGNNQLKVFRGLAVKDKIAALRASQHLVAAVREFVFACLASVLYLDLQNPEPLQPEPLQPEPLKAVTHHPQSNGL